MGMEISSGQPNINLGGNGMGGDWGIMFLAFLAMMGGGFGGWGGNRGPMFQPTGDQAPVSSAQFQSGMNMQNLSDQNRDILNATNNVYHDITANLDSRYAELQRDVAANAVGIQQIQANTQQCCCQIKQEIAALNLENEKRFNALSSKMDQQEIQRLRDQLALQSQSIQDLKSDIRMQSVFRMPQGYTFNAGPGPFASQPLPPPFPVAAGF